MTLKGYFTLAAASFMLLSCHKNNGGDEQVVKTRVVDKIAGARVWQGFSSAIIFHYDDSMYHYDTTFYSSFTDSVIVINDSTIQFADVGKHMYSHLFSHLYTDSTRGTVCYEADPSRYLYYNYNTNAIRIEWATSGIHVGWAVVYTP